MSQSLIADRLGDVIELTRGERVALAKLEQRSRALRRGTTVQRENDRSSELFVVTQGMLMSYALLPDGSRQILRFLFGGDVGGTSALLYAKARETVVAVTEAVMAPFERTLLAEVVGEHPRLAALFMATSQAERVALTDRLAALGRTSAKARVVSLLVELHDRMRRADPSISDSFYLHLTQEEMGDATGLTAVHVNRMLRQLEEEGQIVRRGGRITLVDPARMASTASYNHRVGDLDLGWLPPARG